MAVEARNLNLHSFSSQQQFISSNQANGLSYMGSGLLENNGNVNGSANGSGLFLPFNYQSVMCDSVVQPKTSVNTDSGLTYNLPPSRKRQRDTFVHAHHQFNGNGNSNAVVGDDVLPLLQQYQMDIDRIISHHTKKVRMELEERQKQQSRMLVAAIGEGVMKKLKEKDEQIQRMGKINLVLQEKVKSLYVENQIWRDLAQTNEATANSLRTNLEQVLAHVGADEVVVGNGGNLEEDVESCCGSSDEHAEERRMLAGEAQDNRRMLEAQDNRMCKRCGERESSVLLLPCRHLCLCGVCGSSLLQACPVCNSSMNATVHVNMSDS